MHQTVEKYTKHHMDNINFIGGGALPSGARYTPTSSIAVSAS
jgi:hypothetical protein